MNYKAIIQTPIGKLGIAILDQLLTRLDFLTDDRGLMNSNERTLKNIINQLNQYFLYPNFVFNISYHLQGTPFQKKVWQALSNLPIQKTVSYSALAKKLKTSPRAIGNACQKNPLPILIPCHRVIGQGNLGGYKGKDLVIKKWLLNYEFHTTVF